VLPKPHFPSAKASGLGRSRNSFDLLLGSRDWVPNLDYRLHQISHISGNPNILELHVRGAGRTWPGLKTCALLVACAPAKRSPLPARCVPAQRCLLSCDVTTWCDVTAWCDVSAVVAVSWCGWWQPAEGRCGGLLSFRLRQSLLHCRQGEGNIMFLSVHQHCCFHRYFQYKFYQTKVKHCVNRT
jgi:hypothetical protein